MHILLDKRLPCVNTDRMYIKVRVKTGAKNETVRKVTDGIFEISVREKPEQNAANKRVLELIARELRIRASALRIVSGHHRPSKVLAIVDKHLAKA